MFQKEMANRILAKVNSKDYGRSNISKLKYEVKKCLMYSQVLLFQNLKLKALY